MDDELIHGESDQAYLANTSKILERLRSKKVTANPKKPLLGLNQVEYAGHLISSEAIYPREAKENTRLPITYYTGSTPTIHWTRQLLQRPCSEYD